MPSENITNLLTNDSQARRIFYLYSQNYGLDKDLDSFNPVFVMVDTWRRATLPHIDCSDPNVPAWVVIHTPDLPVISVSLYPEAPGAPN